MPQPGVQSHRPDVGLARVVPQARVRVKDPNQFRLVVQHHVQQGLIVHGEVPTGRLGRVPDRHDFPVQEDEPAHLNRHPGLREIGQLPRAILGHLHLIH